MTFRTRTVEKRNRRRSSHSSDARRTLLLNIGFVVAIVGALSILGGVMFANWYSDHWSPVASVNGHRITKDDVRARADVLKARYQQQKNQITQMQNAGLLTADQASSQQSTIQQQMDPSSLMSEALTQLQTEIVLQRYADENKVSISDAQVQAALDKDATTPERRHVKVIAVTPIPADGKTVPSPDEVAAAKTKAQGYLDEITGGAKWDDVATKANVDYQARPSGDVGLVTKTDSQMDPILTDKVFALKAENDMTDVVESADWIFRFATVTKIIPEQKAANWRQTLQDGGAPGDALTGWARGQALRDELKSRFTKQYIDGETVQRRVLDIFVPSASGTGDEVKSRLIVLAPNKDVTKAPTLAADDKAWTEAKQRADAAYQKVKDGNVDTFKAEAKNGDYKEVAQIEGELPYLTQDFFSEQYLNMAEAGTELFKDGVKLEQVFEPVKTKVGYVIAQFAGRRADASSRILDAELQLNSGADFATVARSVSQGADASKGGEMGWVSKYQMDPDIERAIFSTPVGSITPTVSTANGSYVFKVLEEQKRTIDGSPQGLVQRGTLEANGFNNWLNELQSKASTWEDTAAISSLSSSPATNQ